MMRRGDCRDSRLFVRRRRADVLLATLLVPLLLSALAACSSRAATSQPLRVGLVTSLAGLHDAGLNDLTYAGVQRAEKTLGATGNVAQPGDLGDIAPAMLHDVKAGDNVIVGVGDQMEYAAAQVAQQYPSVTFLLIDAMPLASDALQYTLQLPNVASLYFDDQEAGALAGGFAALLLQQRQPASRVSSTPIGVFSTGPLPPTTRFLRGFTWGVQYMQGRRTAQQPSAVKMTYTNNANPGTITSACVQAVTQAANSGAQLLLGLNAACQQAVIQVADAYHLPCVGVFANQAGRGACVAGSVVERADQVTYSMLAAIAHHTFTSGIHAYDLASGDITLTGGAAKLTPTLRTRLDTFEQQLRSHQLVPTQYAG